MAEDHLETLLRALLDESGLKRTIPVEKTARWQMLRALMNERSPGNLTPEMLRWQDAELAAQREEKGIVQLDDIPELPRQPRIRLWQGDITRLAVDGIVNAANSALLGCFSPLHNCIDNVIHSAAGMQLREECAAIMREQGRHEPAGHAKLTRGYNLPARWVLHTVGPVARAGQVSARDREELASCYNSCLELAEVNDMESLAFCCVSTGVFGFPQEEAAKIAIRTVRDFVASHDRPDTVIFNVFTDKDMDIYRRLLGHE